MAGNTQHTLIKLEQQLKNSPIQRTTPTLDVQHHLVQRWLKTVRKDHKGMEDKEILAMHKQSGRFDQDMSHKGIL